jgi:hypothetical protein
MSLRADLRNSVEQRRSTNTGPVEQGALDNAERILQDDAGNPGTTLMLRIPLASVQHPPRVPHPDRLAEPSPTRHDADRLLHP